MSNFDTGITDQRVQIEQLFGRVESLDCRVQELEEAAAIYEDKYDKLMKNTLVLHRALNKQAKRIDFLLYWIVGITAVLFFMAIVVFGLSKDSLNARISKDLEVSTESTQVEEVVTETEEPVVYTELLPCPLCGGKAQMNSISGDTYCAWVECTECGLSQEYHFSASVKDAENDAKKDWNVRVGGDADDWTNLQ